MGVCVNVFDRERVASGFRKIRIQQNHFTFGDNDMNIIERYYSAKKNR